tara:strand:+ start:60 stop:377 length:318 start_codon:yes stop_codon:yes gene_type:complete
MKNLTTEDFDKEILLSPNFCVVDFYAEWCGPCKAIAPYLEKLEEFYKNVDFFKVDIDKEPDLAQRFKVSSVPTFKFIYKGKVEKTQVGVTNPQELETLIRLGAER